jgi:hypothetical protein
MVFATSLGGVPASNNFLAASIFDLVIERFLPPTIPRAFGA